MNTPSMTSQRPYLLRAIHERIVDNHLTPYIVVDAGIEGVQVPLEYIEGGQIVLNISPEAVRGLHMDNDRIVFSARFAGRAQQLFIPPHAVLEIYVKETGRRMVFVEDENDLPSPEGPAPTDSKASKGIKKKPKLKVVK